MLQSKKAQKKRPKGTNRRRCALGNKDYHKRSTVESVFHALKQRIMPNLRSKIHYMKKREMAWTIILFNMTRIKNTIQPLITKLYLNSG